jgi:autophagy-related protein 17
MRDLKPSMKAASRSSASQSGTLDSPIPQHLQSLESNAQEMAALLSSLVSHFDLCVNAVRHTEGGYAAVRQAASSQPAGLEPVSVSGVMKSAEESSPELEPISEEERQEMLDVLVKDAEQVEDVVIEMSEFLSEMEQKHEAILEYVSDLNNIYKATLSTFGKLEDISRTLPTYIIASQDFTLRWTEIKYTIDTQLHELENMRLFYESYHSSYDNLLLEVSRRRQTEDKVKNIMRKAMEQVEKVIEGDRVEREAFRMDFGEFLPNDLWSGVDAEPGSWEFVRKGLKEGREGWEESVPELRRSVVEAAERRDRERQAADGS